MRLVPAIIVVLLAVGVAVAAMLVEAPKIEQRITAEAEAALDGVGLTAEIDGRDATLIGVARDADHRDTGLIRLAAIGEVDILRDHTVIPVLEGPYTLSAARMVSGEIFLHGVLPDAVTRSALVSHFQDVDLGPVRDFTRIVPGAPEGWTDRAVAAVSALDTLVQGSALVVGDEVTISGLYAEDDSAAAFARLSTPGWRVFLAIDQSDAVEALQTQTDALRADLLDAADTIETQKADAQAQADALSAEIETARAELAELQALLSGAPAETEAAAPADPQTTEPNP